MEKKFMKTKDKYGLSRYTKECRNIKVKDHFYYYSKAVSYTMDVYLTKLYHVQNSYLSYQEVTLDGRN